MKVLEEIRSRTIDSKVEARFGPNPCEDLKLLDQESGELLELVCDRKRCGACGPRKRYRLELSLEAGLGRYPYLRRFDDLTDVERALQRLKRRRSRGGSDFRYQIVGDRELGWIVVSDVPLVPEMRRQDVREWFDRIADLYRRSLSRIRRSTSLARLSLVPNRGTKRNGGQQGESRFRAIFRRRLSDRELADERDQRYAEELGLDSWDVWVEDGRIETTISRFRTELGDRR